jgi:Transposase DDE domain group 1
VKITGARPKISVSADGRGVVGHAGARLLVDLADATGLAAAFGEALAGSRQREGGHDPGRVAVDLAAMIADGGEAIADLAVLRDQADFCSGRWPRTRPHGGYCPVWTMRR